MSKEDVPPLPDKVPTKRRQLGQVLDVHIAMWLACDDITPSERRKLEALKESRKQRDEERKLGLLIAREGVTPKQGEAIIFLIQNSKPTAIHHHVIPSKLHQFCRTFLRGNVVVHREGDYTERVRHVIKTADALIAAPRDTREPEHKEEGTVWWGVKYARHRDKSVTIVLPDGRIM